jgi:thiol:disulfide interchange protein DsbD
VTSLIALFAIGLQEPACRVTATPVEPEARTGKPLEVAIQFEFEPGWHIYWKNPGDSGEPTSIKWTLPKGWKEVDLRFPVPHAIDMGGIVNYGYENRVTLIARLQPAPNYQGEPVNLSGEVSYLICKTACVPGSRKFALSIPGDPIDGEVWRETFRALPSKYMRTLTSKYEGRNLVVALQEKRVTKAYFFAEDANLVAHSSPQQLRKTDTGYELTIPLSEFATSRPKKVVGVLALTSDAESVRGYNVELTP